MGINSFKFNQSLTDFIKPNNSFKSPIIVKLQIDS